MTGKKSSSRSRLGIISIIILVVNFFAIFLLLLSYLSVHISPDKNWALPFFGLLYPYLLIINVAFVVFWAVRRKWAFLFSFAVILLGWNHMGRLFRISGNDEFETGKYYVKLTSYNVKNLSNDNVDLIDKDVRNSIISFLESTGSDILCLQELMIVHPDPDSFIDSLSGILGLNYHSYAPYFEKTNRGIDAIFTFSRYPIISTGQLEFDSSYNYGHYSDILVKSDTFRLFNVHLESIRLRHEDYSFISGLDLQFEKDENIRENSLRIFKKLKVAFHKRSRQADHLSAMIHHSPYPVILCGDFNDTPNSYVYQSLTGRLQDAFIESGSGFGNTYIGKVPSFRIDFILFDDYFHSREFRRGNIRYSDHYPISCYIGWTVVNDSEQ